jgi:hypothetical protein
MATVNISVKDDTKVGASLIEIARNLSKQYKSVVVHEEISEDEWLAKEMTESRKSGKGNKKKVMDFLKD